MYLWFFSLKIIIMSKALSFHSVFSYIFNHIIDKFKPEIEDIEIWTDGPSSQFGNKFIFAYAGVTLPQIFDFKITWNYSAKVHDKRTVYVIGGTVKRVATYGSVTIQMLLFGYNPDAIKVDSFLML